MSNLQFSLYWLPRVVWMYIQTWHGKYSLSIMQAAFTGNTFGRPRTLIARRHLILYPKILSYRNGAALHASSGDEGRCSKNPSWTRTKREGCALTLSAYTLYGQFRVFHSELIWGDESIPDTSEGAFTWLEEQGVCWKVQVLDIIFVAE